jgi:glutathionylspermidine synthase
LSDFKVLEANSATPGLLFETFVLNSLICKHFKKRCPNENLARKQTVDFISYLETISDNKFDLVKDTLYFAFPYSGNHEDILSFDARMGWFQKLGGKAEFCYIDQLTIETDSNKPTNLYSPSGELVEYLFIHYPNEWMIEDQGKEVISNDFVSTPGARPWDYILQLILEKKLVKLPPISSYIVQNKGLFAFMWSGVNSNSVDDETASMMKTLIPQTYCTFQEATITGLTRIWEKPIYGREGAGVVLTVDGNEAVNTYAADFDEDSEWYNNMLAVFQQDCSMPKLLFDDTDVTLMFTVYLSAEGNATGISCRASKGIGETAIDTNNGIWFPLSLK